MTVCFHINVWLKSNHYNLRNYYDFYGLSSNLSFTNSLTPKNDTDWRFVVEAGVHRDIAAPAGLKG